jgi:hypothetical protein
VPTDGGDDDLQHLGDCPEFFPSASAVMAFVMKQQVINNNVHCPGHWPYMVDWACGTYEHVTH